MRCIKFRAWNGKWMIQPEYGDWVSFDGVPYTEAEQRYDTPNIEVEKAKDYILIQYTGLKDKNGKEIYEGDIFGSKMLRCFVIRKKSGAYEVEFANKKIKNISILDRRVLNSEVIGNIYEHKHLLTK